MIGAWDVRKPSETRVGMEKLLRRGLLRQSHTDDGQSAWGDMSEMRENEGTIISMHGNDEYVGMEGDKGERERRRKEKADWWLADVCGIA